jgi:ABC-2 type transport system permease protein
MFNLIRNEWMKIFRRTGTYVMVGMVLLIIAVSSGFIKYQDVSAIPNQEEGNWKQVLQQENQALQRQLESSPVKMEQDYYKQQIAINEYRIENDIPFREKYNVWTFVKESSELIMLAGVFTIIVSSGIVASEFNWGTIKLLLIRPINRTKILLSKYITVLLFALFMLIVLFGFSALVGAILFGAPANPLPYLNYVDGKVVEQNIVVHLFIHYGLSSVEMIMLATMAFMISSVFRSGSIAIGLSLFLMFTGSTFTAIISLRYDWAKYSLFANTNLVQYVEGAPLVEGMTMSFSLIVLFIYFFIFQLLAFLVFKKRDVAA